MTETPLELAYRSTTALRLQHQSIVRSLASLAGPSPTRVYASHKPAVAISRTEAELHGWPRSNLSISFDLTATGRGFLGLSSQGYQESTRVQPTLVILKKLDIPDWCDPASADPTETAGMALDDEHRHSREDVESQEEDEITPTVGDHVQDAAHSKSPSRIDRPSLVNGGIDIQRANVQVDALQDRLSPMTSDRVFPIRSVVSVDATATPQHRSNEQGYFPSPNHARKMSQQALAGNTMQVKRGRTSNSRVASSQASNASEENRDESSTALETPEQRPTPLLFNNIQGDSNSTTSSRSASRISVGRPASARAPSMHSVDNGGGLFTARFKHVVTEHGHAIITGRDGETLQRCEDEPIHIPGAIQGFGLLVALEEQQEGKLLVRVVSENAKRLIGYTPQQLFKLESFTDILSEEQADNLLDHVDFIRDEDADVVVNGPEVFTLSIRLPNRRSKKLWCAMHVSDSNPNLIICEFEVEDDQDNPLVPVNEETPEPPEDTLNSNPTEEEFAESTQNTSKPLRVLRSARKRRGEAAAMEVFNIMSQVQEQLASAPNLESFLKILVGVVKELTGFHRVMVYQFDQNWNGRVVTELVDPRATKDLYKGLNFPASDIPKQARDLYRINKVRMLYDRDQETARLVCRTIEDLETPLDLTHAYLRAMSPIHVKYLANMAVRSSMSISINAFEELWGLIACHTYGPKGMRVSFPIRKMCRLVGDSASRNIERLSYASRLQARKLINTVPTHANPSGYIIASSDDLLKLFAADFGLLSVKDETKILGNLEQSQEALAMLEYLRLRRITNVLASQDIKVDFPDLRYPPGFNVIAGLLLVPLSTSGQDFIVFFRKGQLREVKWAGNPYEKFVKEGTEGYLEPRKSFRTWSETVVGKCREWSEEEIETAAVLCLVYGKFIEVWRQKEAALQNSQLTRLLLANSAHEVRTPLNAIINYLEIALEGSLDQETRDNLSKSHSASKSLIYVINDLLDLTKTEEGADLVKDEVFDLTATLSEATEMFSNDARRKNIVFQVTEHPGLPSQVIGDQRRVRQAISNITANAIQHTRTGSINIDMYITSRQENHVEVEVSIEDTGVGMSSKKLDALFRDLEQVQSEEQALLTDVVVPESSTLDSPKEDTKTLGLGLAVVARIVRNMNGQLRLKSEEGSGSRFVIQFPFDLPSAETALVKDPGTEVEGSPVSSSTLHGSPRVSPGPSAQSHPGELTLVHRDDTPRPDSAPHNGIRRANSADSTNSKFSMASNRSHLSRSSQHSNKSEADRLIEALQEPHLVEGWSGNKRSGRPSSITSAPSSIARPDLGSRNNSKEVRGSPSNGRQRSKSGELGAVAHRRSEVAAEQPGQLSVRDSARPVKSVRVPEGMVVSSSGTFTPSWTPSSSTSDSPRLSKFSSQPAQIQESATTATSRASPSSPTSTPMSTEAMQVLVAEDDPVNSRIIKKRLERLGHVVTLTVNGEECSSVYAEKPEFFDIVLMDMQVSGSTEIQDRWSWISNSRHRCP
nr:cyanobacterial phytochrome b [Quercus suber]